MRGNGSTIILIDSDFPSFGGDELNTVVVSSVCATACVSRAQKTSLENLHVSSYNQYY